ncbi:MAG: glycosyltransferase [Clostridia bacterium]|nr:glycosyltransferase [Clostridia bacterium]
MCPSEKIRIIHLLTDEGVGGAGKHLFYLLSCLDRDIFDASVILPEGAKMSGYFRSAGIRVTEIPGFTSSRAPRCGKTLTRIFKEEKPSIVHTHSSYTGRIAAKRAGVPVTVMTKHCSDMPPEYTRDLLGRTLCRAHFRKYLTAAISTDRSATDALLACGMPRGMITLIENGALPLPEHTAEEKASLLKELDIPEGSAVCGAFSRLEPVKAHADLLAAAALLRRQATNLYFLIAGTGSLEEELKALAGRYGVSDRVRFCGFAQDIAVLMSVCDYNINMSVGTETTNLALTEGMSLGVVPIASDIGGNRELVSNCGICFAPGDPPALASAILSILRDPPGKEFFSRKAKEEFFSRRTAQMMAAKTSELYLRLLENNRRT